MKLPALLFAILLCLGLPAVADDTPPAPAPPAPQNEPNPSAPAGSDKQPARKEEDEEEKRTGLFGDLFGKKSRKEADKLKAESDDLAKRMESLENENKRLAKENEDLTSQVNAFNEQWPQIEASLISGDESAEALSTAFGEKIKAAVSKAVTRAHARSGHNPLKLPGKGADKPEPPKTEGEKSNIAGKPGEHFAAHWAAKGWTPPGLN